MDNNNTEKITAKVELLLEGEIAEKFLAYKEAEHLRSNAQTAYKLLAEKLEDAKQ